MSAPSWLGVLGLLLLPGGSGSATGPAGGKVFLTQSEALGIAFEGCAVERLAFYLTDEEKARATRLAGEECEASAVFAYVGRKDGKLAGTAYFDVHRVRTRREVLMIVVSPSGAIRRVEVLAFAEPLEYLARPSFYAQFVEKKLDPELQLKASIRGVIGATLTSQATTQAARRILALHKVLEERTQPPPKPPAKRSEPSDKHPAPNEGGEMPEGRG